MAMCETCGNAYGKAFTVIIDNARHTFGSLGYAIQALVPTCAHCGCRIIGHGVEKDGTFFVVRIVWDAQDIGAAAQLLMYAKGDITVKL